MCVPPSPMKTAEYPSNDATEHAIKETATQFPASIYQISLHNCTNVIIVLDTRFSPDCAAGMIIKHATIENTIGNV